MKEQKEYWIYKYIYTYIYMYTGHERTEGTEGS
jgi:hypothetical protein